MRRVSISDPDFTYDPDDAEGFRSGMFRLGGDLGAERTGTTVYELPPGEAIGPYHYEDPEEEWLLVVDGSPTLRHPGGEEVLETSDVVYFPPGPEGAHMVRNDTGSTVRVLMFSTMTEVAAVVYPDSDKISIWTTNNADDIVVRRASGVDYWEGESRGRES